MRLTLLLLPFLLSACVNSSLPTATVQPDPEKGFWVVHSGHGNAEKISLKKHDGSEQMIDERGLVSNPVLDADGEHLAYFKEKWRSDRSLIIQNIASEKADIYPTGRGIRTGLAWTGDNRSLFLVSNGALARFDTKTKELGYYLKHQSPESLSASPDGKYLLFITREGHNVNAIDGWMLNLFDIQTAQSRPLGTPVDNKGHFGSIFWSPDSKRFIVGTHLLGGPDKQPRSFPGAREVLATESRWYTLDYKPLTQPKDDDLIYHPEHYPHVISVRHAAADKLDPLYRNNPSSGRGN